MQCASQDRRAPAAGLMLRVLRPRPALRPRLVLIRAALRPPLV